MPHLLVAVVGILVSVELARSLGAAREGWRSFVVPLHRGRGRLVRGILGVVGEQLQIRAGMGDDDVAGWMRRFWGDTVMAVHGRVYDVGKLPALVAVTDGAVVGVLTYCVDGDGLEVVSCDADPPARGVGRALVGAALVLARELSLRRVWCTTTNDNLAALGFWQAVGFVLVALRPDAVADARRLKPSIPDRGHRGVPIRDELDLELVL